MSQNEPDKQMIHNLLKTAQKPADLSLKRHAYYKGKMATMPKCPIHGYDDFSIWYSPGVAAPCRAITESPDEVYALTNKGNTIAVISDGSRVLGLGDIGPEAGLPVMEGKCLLFKYLGGVDAVPLMLDVKEEDAFVETVLRLQPSFGGINLEDIAQPKCFNILARLQGEAHIPVWHDDQQGTATVTLAALMNALKLVGKRKEAVRIAFIGAGAANIACSRLIFAWGVDPNQVLMVDENGILGKHRVDLQDNPHAWAICQGTNPHGKTGGIPEAMQDMDVVIAYSTPGPGIILPEWVEKMRKDAIIFACANPIPEIWPWEAKTGGAAVIATGRSDFPNQVNNALSFPGIFRGVLDVRASQITDEMCFAAARALANYIDNDIDETRILPKMTDTAIFPLQAAAVGMEAQNSGVARVSQTYPELLNHAEAMIAAAQSATSVLMGENCIPPLPED